MLLYALNLGIKTFKDDQVDEFSTRVGDIHIKSFQFFPDCLVSNDTLVYRLLMPLINSD